MNLFSYIVKSDSGFSPNPFHGFCTLACCKPGIRQSAKNGDWIAGLSSKAQGHRLVFAMLVEEALPFAQYWSDKRFLDKRPDFRSPCGMLGDNIYEPLGDGETFRQHRSRHSHQNTKYPPGSFKRYTDNEDEASKKRDLSGKRVLASIDFVYFGTRAAVELPESLRTAMAVGRGYRNRFSPQILEEWQTFVAALPRGIQGQGDSGNCRSICASGKRKKQKSAEVPWDSCHC